MNLVRATIHAAAAVILVACASAEPSPPLVPASGPPAARAVPITGSGCAFGVRGAKASIENVSMGVIVTFTVEDAASVEELRDRVKNVAAQHGPGAHEGMGHDGAHGSRDHHGLHLSEMPPVETSSQSVDGGARLHVLARSTADVRSVQNQMWSRIETVAASSCQ
jgi:hypothetical protein